jgi:type II secretion system (T2SS) protein M
LSRAERKILKRGAALLILLALLGVFWIGPVAAYLDLLDADARQLALKEQLLQRYRGLAEPARREPESAAAAAAPLLFPQVSDSEMVALLQQALKAAAAEAQIDVRGLQVLQAEALPGTSRIGVRLRGTGDIVGLNRLLYRIEAARPLLYPDNLQVRSQAARPATAPGALDFEVDVSGFKAGPAT